MKGRYDKYPEQSFELQDFGLGEGLVVAFDLQGFLSGIECAQKEGWTLVIECNETVQVAFQFQAKIIKEGFEVEKEVVNQEEKKAPEEQAEAESSDDGENSIDFVTLAELENTKENRKLVDDLANENGIELDRRKLQSVEKLVAEFEKQYAGK